MTLTGLYLITSLKLLQVAMRWRTEKEVVDGKGICFGINDEHGDFFANRVC